MANEKNRGRSDEARDPDRPIDPVTGEKEGLGPRDETPEEPANPSPVDVDIDESIDGDGEGDTPSA